MTHLKHKLNSFLKHKIMISNFLILLILSLSFSSCDKDKNDNDDFNHNKDIAIKIAKWQGDKKSVLTLQFDDSTPGQAQLGIPALISRNIVGTWYVNPGRYAYESNLNTWENIAPAGGQELANHTMNHDGASSYDEIVYEVGEASKIIWQIRGDENFGSLIAFNRGGGTSWNEEDLAKVLEEYKNIDRQSYLGIPIKALSVSSGSDADDMFEIIPKYINDSNIIRIHFHGIAKENGDPPMDYGNAAVWINEFNTFLDKLVEKKDELWFGGYIEVYKYIKEKENATVLIQKNSDSKYTVRLTSNTDPKFFNEELTIVASILGNWESCEVSYNGETKTYNVQNGNIIFDAKPNKGDIKIILK